MSMMIGFVVLVLVLCAAKVDDRTLEVVLALGGFLIFLAWITLPEAY